ncbi:hypothetical protein MD484_g6287, partial [Candolleomyces efflorescens]
MTPSFGTSLRSFSTFMLILLTLSQFFTPSVADGYGMIGAGKWLYKPVCAHACRRVIYKNRLTCDSKLPTDNTTVHLQRRATNPTGCFLKDAAFLRTMALCIEKACDRDNISISTIEGYWESHLATGTIGDMALRPIMSYQEALLYAHQDAEETGLGNLPYSVMGEPLNMTSLVRDQDFVPYYNALMWSERVEKDHGRNAVAIAVSSVFIPVLFSLLRFLPIHPLWYSRLIAILEKPLAGYRHRSPVVADMGIMPTRGQALYILYLITTQILLAIFPLAFSFPNYFSPTRMDQVMGSVGYRTGVLTMANFVALFLFASRNNVLFWITNWSRSTFLLLHRWIAYCLILQVSVHSAIQLVRHYEDHDTESEEPYWIWGIVGTLAFVVLWPASILPLRKKVYELFLAFHQVFAAIALVASFFHIYKESKYDRGYEIWVYIGGAFWFFDRFLRLLRMIASGHRTAVVTPIGLDSEYLKVEIDGVVAHGHVYLYFPTLPWRFWQSHPFSVLSTFSGTTMGSGTVVAIGDAEKMSPTGSGSDLSNGPSPSAFVLGRPKATILVRPMDGLTKALAARLGELESISIPVIVEGSYHANPAIRNLDSCSTLVCIAGGVGITAVVPILRSFEGVKARLAWGARSEWLLRSVDDEIRELVKRGVKVETRISGDANERLRVGDIVQEELESGDGGDLGVVVCGPTGMADEVRMAIAEFGSKGKRGVVFVDEAFSW